MRTLLASLLLLSWVNSVAVQKSLPTSAPGEPHAALARLAGTWQAHARFWMSPDSSVPPTECRATVNAAMIMGGRFLFQRVEGQCMGQPLEAIGVIGHDNATGCYQAVSFSNIGTSIAQHVGEKNDAGDIVLHSSYQDQATGATVNRRTVRTMISENEWVETAHETRTGADQKVMEIRARRTNGHLPSRP
jgi:Protein of unknown function (DUF1579)